MYVSRMVAAVLLVASAGYLSADVLYSVTNLGNSGSRFVRGYGVNNTGQVTGEADAFSPPPVRAFVYSNGSRQDLGNLGGSYTRGFAINNLGQVTGLATTSPNSNATHAFFYSDGHITDLGLGTGYSINDSGQIAGMVPTASGAGHAALFSNGQVTDLGTLPNYSKASEARGINNAGQIAGTSSSATGSRAFLYQNGQMQDLGLLSGGSGYSSATGINAAGEVTGTSGVSGGSSHAFLYSNGQMQDLGSLTGSSGYSEASGINSAGQVVGDSSAPVHSSAVGGHAFLYSNGQMYDLNNLIDPALHLEFNYAEAINDEGQIVVSYVYDGPGASTYLLTPLLNPVPEPGTVMLGAAALSLMGILRLGRVAAHSRSRF